MGSQRIAGLDLWRALLAIGGLFVHASYQLPPVPLFAIVECASQAFRMGVFFAISGLLAAVMLERRPTGAWLRGRVAQLGIPAIIGLTTISPLIWWLVATAPQVVGRMPLRYEWHHLWFLYGLIFYSGVAVIMHRADRAHRLARRIDAAARNSGSGRLVLWLTGVAAALLVGTAGALMRTIMPDWTLRPFSNLQMIAGYLPMYVLGFVLGRCPLLRASVIGRSGFAAAVLALSAAGLILSHALPIGEQCQAQVRFIAASLGPPVAFTLILRSAVRIQRVPTAIRSVADASYTIYLLHLPLAAAINTRLGPWLEPHIAYALCVMLAGLSSYAIHVYVIARCPPLGLLLNGRIVRGPERRRQEPATIS